MNSNKADLFFCIRTNRKGWSAGLLVLLLGGWLSVICQQCLAYADYPGNPDGTVSHTKEHCPTGADQQGKAPGLDHCSSSCDCVAVVTVSETNKNLQDVIAGFSTDNQFTFQARESGLYRTVKFDPSSGIYREPEHSRPLPFEYFRILLI